MRLCSSRSVLGSLLLLLSFGCAAPADPGGEAAVPPPVPLGEALTRLHKGDPAELSAYRSPRTGEITQLAGRFVPPGGAVTASWIEVVLDTMAEGRGHLARRQIPALPATDALHFVRVEQLIGGLPVRGREIIVQLEGGAVIGVSGRILDDVAVPPSSSRVDPEQLVRAAGITGPHRAHREWDPELKQPVWAIESDQLLVWTDDAGRIVRTASPIVDSYEASTCKIRHPIYEKGSDGRATDLGVVADHVSDRVSKCGRENLGNVLCTYELSYHPAVANPLGRVNDELASEVDVQRGCVDPPALFSGTSAAATRQQSLFYAQERMRSFIDQNMWSKVTPERSADVQIVVQADACNTLFSNAPACFSHLTTDIYIDSSRADDETRNMQTIMHEFGHYVNWTYGDLSSSCWSLIDEGGAIHETFADINGLISMIDDPEYNLAYDTAGVRLSQQPSRHRDGTAPLLYSPLACDTANDIHDVGRPLQQAMWEILWNQNCASGDSCPTSLHTFGDDLWPGATQEHVLAVVGEAVGRALQATGSAPTYDEVLSWFLIRIQTTGGPVQGAIDAARVRAVLVHHGFNP